MQVESPTTADTERLVDLWVALADGQRAHGSHLDSDRNRGQIKAAIGRHVVSDRLRIVRDDDRIIGFVMFSVESGSLERDIDRGLVENIYVIPERRNEGIGSALLRAAETALGEAGVDVVTLDIMADNEAARSFYRTQGYRPHRVTVEKPIESDTHSKGDD